MRILAVISHGYAAGGAERSAILIREELTRRGHEVKILSASSTGHQLFSDYQFETINPRSPLKTLDHLFYRKSYQAMRRIIADFKPDVIHFHTLTSCTPSVLFGARGVPAVMTIHGPEEFTVSLVPWLLPESDYRTRPFDITDFTPVGWLRYHYNLQVQRPIYRLGFRYLAKVIAPSKYILEATRDDFAGREMVHIYNGIELPALQPITTAPNLLYVGRLERYKGVDVLLRAFAAARTRVPQLNLRIVGEGSQRAELELLARELGVESHVSFPGWLTSAEVLREYARSCALMVPSVWPENLPTVCLEAMAAGLPVIGTDTGGIPELIDPGVTGLIVPVGDVDALAAAICELTSDPANMKQLGLNAAKQAGKFSIEHFVDEIEQTYVAISGRDAAGNSAPGQLVPGHGTEAGQGSQHISR